MPDNERRAAFLAGEATLTAHEVRVWAYELAPQHCPQPLPAGLPLTEPLMVSVVAAPVTNSGVSPARRGHIERMRSDRNYREWMRGEAYGLGWR